MNRQNRGPCDCPNKELVSTARSTATPGSPKTADGRDRTRGGNVDAAGLRRDPTAAVIKTR